MKRGFTLIELLAVVVILAILLIIAVPTIKDIIITSKIESYQNQVKLIENVTKLYTLQNPEILPTTTGESAEVTIATLLSGEYLKEPLEDPRTGELIDDTSVVKITLSVSGDYTYEYIEPSGVEPVLLTSALASNVGIEGTYEQKNVGTSNEAYFFVGLNPNNWVEFGKDESGNTLMWRIVKYNDEGIKIIYEGVKNGTSTPIEDGRISINGTTSVAWDTNGLNHWENPASLKPQLTSWYSSLQIDTNDIAPINWCNFAIADSLQRL